MRAVTGKRRPWYEIAMTPKGAVVTPASRPLAGELRVPGDKSIAHRALIFGALADGGLRVAGLPSGEDVAATWHALMALGVTVVRDGDAVHVRGPAPDRRLRQPRAPLDCANSGTTMRLLMGLLAGQEFESILVGDASLSRRPMARVAAPLRAMGAEVRLVHDQHAPVHILGRRPLTPWRGRLEVASAQVKSAILIASLYADGASHIDAPFPTRDHSERLLTWLGGPALLRAPAPLAIPGDISSAAAFIAAATLVSGSHLDLVDVGLNPTRTGFLDALARMGATIDRRDERELCDEPWGTLAVSAADLVGITVDATEVPRLIDEVPLLAVLATQARGRTRIAGLAELRLKESDRLAATLAGLYAMGARVSSDGDDLVVDGPARLRGTAIDTHGDHRLAMAFAVAALVADGPTTLSDAACAAVSYAEFLATLTGLVEGRGTA